MAEGSLSDVRIVDLTQGIAGPYCTKLFASLGAEVIKVEPPAGDVSRTFGPFPGNEPHPEKSGLYLHLNTGKKSVTLDLEADAGRSLLKKLLAEADVLIEGDGQTRMAELGLAHDDLKGGLPNLVYVSVTPFGCTGPYKDYRGNSLTAMAFQGAIRGRFYSRHVFGYPMDIMSCKDGHVVVIPGASGFSQPGLTPEGTVSSMALLMEDPDLDQNPLFQSGQQRMIQWKEVDKLIQPFLDTKEVKEIVEFAQALRMPFAPVPTVKDLVEDEHLQSRDFFQQVDHPEAGELTYAGPPFRMTETPPTISRAPTLGEHNGEFDA